MGFWKQLQEKMENSGVSSSLSAEVEVFGGRMTFVNSIRWYPVGQKVQLYSRLIGTLALGFEPPQLTPISGHLEVDTGARVDLINVVLDLKTGEWKITAFDYSNFKAIGASAIGQFPGVGRVGGHMRYASAERTGTGGAAIRQIKVGGHGGFHALSAELGKYLIRWGIRTDVSFSVDLFTTW